MNDERQTAPIPTVRVQPTRLERLMGGGQLTGGQRLNALARLALFAAALLVLSVASVAIDWGSGQIVVREGDAADQTIKAEDTISFESELRTHEARQAAYDDDSNIALVNDEGVRPEQVAAVDTFLNRVAGLREADDLNDDEKVRSVRDLLEGLSDQDAEEILALSDTAWERVRAESRRLVDVTLANRLRAEDVARTKEDISRRVSALLSAEEQPLAAAIARPFVRANVFVDEVQTLRNREAAAEAVDPVTVQLLSGQAVVRDGDIVTVYDIEKLEQLGLLTQGPELSERMGKAGLMVILSLVLVVYLFRFHRPIWQGRQLLLITIVVLGPILMGRLVLPHDEIQYMFPVAASAMLLAVLLEFQIALAVAALLALYLGVIADLSFELVVVYLLASAAGSFVIWKAERTITFVWAGLAVGLTSFLVSICFVAANGAFESGASAELLFEAGVNGALSASLTFLSFSLLGSLFGITTHLQLLELAHPNQPLLYRLAREAPGTYHHSIVVSNLAESGVEIVGGDPLFARVAVLYHDIGKIVRPTFFIENQANLENPHDLLDARVSARVIIDHVIDGARLARKARLPQPMIDIILQHHGTSLIRYFYVKSVEAGEEVTEDEFRYPGPKPQTKQAGVVMLADSIEATVRAAAVGGRLASAKDPGRESSETLSAIVDRIVSERLDDGQLNECDLTLREIELIRRTFVQILEGIYHPRVEYPSMPVKTAPATPAAPAPSIAN
ncbi:MAG: HDIG domain-containing metalloprotein [Thermomicrobiales bacterium]